MKKIKFLVVCIFSSTIMISCGGKEEKKKESFSYEKKEAPVQKIVEASGANIVLTGNDLMKFDKTEIKVTSGQKVTLTLRHIGKLDKKIMGHNFVLLKKDVDLASFANSAATAYDNEYIPKGTNDVIAYTKIIGAGETTVIEFEAPEVGSYEFICSFPGHYAMMRGVFIVQ